jgi:hypothetical protein
MSQYVSGTFFNDERANDAIDDLIALGYPAERIDVIMSPETHGRYARGSAPGETKGAHVAQGAVAGGAIGGALGAIIAGLTATGAITATVATGGAAAPLVAGPLAAALAGLGAGAAAGGLIGALVGAGMSEERAKKVRHDVDAGAIVVGVRADDEDAPDVRLILASDDVADADALRMRSAGVADPLR